jgi:hypothetical protein
MAESIRRDLLASILSTIGLSRHNNVEVKRLIDEAWLFVRLLVKRLVRRCFGGGCGISMRPARVPFNVPGVKQVAQVSPDGFLAVT